MSRKPRVLQKNFSDISVGDHADIKLQIDQALTNKFAQLTGDFNPLHMDSHHAKQTEFGGRVAHGMLVGSLFSRLIGMELPGQNALYLSQALQFRKPILVGTHVHVRAEVMEKSEANRILKLKTVVLDSAGEILIEGEAEVMVTDQKKKEEHSVVKKSASDLSHLVCLVTGGGRGIGAAIAKELALRGAAVAVNYVKDKKSAEGVVSALKKINSRVMAVQADVRKKDDILKMVSQIKKKWGPLQVLVNNAFSDLTPMPFLKTPPQEFHRCWDVIVSGAIHCAQAVLPDMIEKKYGKIINVTTTATRNVPPNQQAPYVTDKTALEGLTRTLAVEFGPSGIRVNAVAPGLTETSLVQFLPARVRDVVAVQTPLHRNADPVDVAHVVTFLASPAADFIHGATLPVCGGNIMV